MKLRLLLFVMALGFLALAAEEKDKKSDVTINSDELKYSFEENTAYLKGHVVVTDGERKLTTDNATVYFDEDKQPAKDAAVEDLGLKGVSGFSRVVAVGNVHVVFSDQQNVKTEVIADRGIWERAKNTVVMTGGPPLVRNGANYLRCRRLTVDLLKSKCDFEAPEIILTPSSEEKEKFLF